MRRSSKRCRRRSAISNIVITESTNSTKRWIGQVVIGEIIRYWITGLLCNSHQKHMYSVIRFYVLAESVKNILWQQELGETIASEHSSKAQNIEHIAASQEKKLVRVEVFYVRKTTIQTLERIKTMEEKEHNHLSFKTGSCSCPSTKTLCFQKE